MAAVEAVVEPLGYQSIMQALVPSQTLQLTLCYWLEEAEEATVTKFPMSATQEAWTPRSLPTELGLEIPYIIIAGHPKEALEAALEVMEA